MADGILTLFGEFGRLLVIKQAIYSYLAISFMYVAMKQRRRRFMYGGLSGFFGATVYLSVAITAGNDDLIWAMRGVNTLVAIWVAAFVLMYQLRGWQTNGQHRQQIKDLTNAVD